MKYLYIEISWKTELSSYHIKGGVFNVTPRIQFKIEDIQCIQVWSCDGCHDGNESGDNTQILEMV